MQYLPDRVDRKSAYSSSATGAKMQEQNAHVTADAGVQDRQLEDRQQSVASGQSAAAGSAVTSRSQKSGSSHSSSSNRKRTGYTIPDPVSVEENGRTFNGYREGKYLLPNDALEQERLDLAHEMWRLLLFGDLSWVPFADEPKQVLDIGTGTGIWAIEFAQQHPASHVVGTDISLIQPPEGSIPSNCTFERDDVEEQWVFDQTFDYIHLRAMLTCFNDHLGLIQKIYDNLVPGGWVEYHDYDPEIFGKDEANQRDLLASPLWNWLQRVFKGANRFGRDMLIARRYKQFLIDTGFVDVTEKIVLAPNKPWPEDPRERRIGQYQQANSLEMIDGVSVKLLQADGMTPDEIESLISQCRESFQSKKLHLYSRIYVVYGRKPRDDELPPKTQKADTTVRDQTTETEPVLHEPITPRNTTVIDNISEAPSHAMTDEDVVPSFDTIARGLELEEEATESGIQSITRRDCDLAERVFEEPAPRCAQAVNSEPCTGDALTEVEVGVGGSAHKRALEETSLSPVPLTEPACLITSNNGAHVEHHEFIDSLPKPPVQSNDDAARPEARGEDDVDEDDDAEAKTKPAASQRVTQELSQDPEQISRGANDLALEPQAQNSASQEADSSDIRRPALAGDFEHLDITHLGGGLEKLHIGSPGSEEAQEHGAAGDANQPIDMTRDLPTAQEQQLNRAYHEELQDLAGIQGKTEDPDLDEMAATQSGISERAVARTRGTEVEQSNKIMPGDNSSSR